jgi:peptidoglycan/LPS O-acetylase OafA/YrhL
MGIHEGLSQVLAGFVYVIASFIMNKYYVFKTSHQNTLMMTNISSTQHDTKHLSHPKYRADIDGLRAIAVLSVVSFHAFPNMLKGGFIGVDIFFVISGFLISTIIFSNLESDNFSFVEFYSRRIKRIFPALLIVLIACFAVGWFVLLADEYKQLGKHIAGGAGFVSNFMFWQESGYFDNAADTKPLLHLWSLGIEEQFYIVWPLLLWFAWKQRLNLLTITITILIISFALNIGKVHNDGVSAFYSPQTRFWELLTGSVLAYITLYKQNLFATFKQKLDAWLSLIIYANEPEVKGNTLRSVQSLLGATIIAIGIIVITKEKSFPGWWAVFPTVGAVLIISAGMGAWLNRAVLANRVLVWFGLISFPLYLWHWPLLSFARIMEGGKPSQGIRSAAVVIAIALAWLTYKLIEKPIRFGNHSKAKTIILFVLMLGIGFTGYYDYKNDGLGFRFPKIVQSLTQEYVHDKEWVGTFCFLDQYQDYTAFNDPAFKACQSQPEDNNKPSIFLWGDSIATAMYPGYKTSFGSQYKIITRTGSSCPPLLNVDAADRPSCKKNNDYIFELIKKEKPKKVVLIAIWSVYDWKRLEGTIEQLRQSGITNIDVVGPVPFWMDKLPRLLYLQFKADKFHRIPERMADGLRKEVFQVDSAMEDFTKKLKVNYISPIKILCNESGCITTVGGQGNVGDVPIVYDKLHLTNKGAQFLVSKFPNIN